MAYFNDFPERLKFFSPKERRDIIFYVCGIMLYRFGLEAFDGSITALATNRYDYESHTNGTPSRTFERLGLLQGLNQVTQCVGSILIAPLIKHYPTKNVLSSAILLFGLMTAILLILDAATGGTFVPAAYRKKHPKNEWPYYGKYDNDAIIPIYTIPGIAYGMVELIRRVIPRDIVGAMVFAATFIPKGSRSFNPELLSETQLNEDVADDSLSHSEKTMVEVPKHSDPASAKVV
ncbi:uncharacterized protein GLRG_00328 [Colletotrichum graminicola M1.001]|uniref:Uncharacterized protein n=1 Tax=Colletotrichum graminicola (strain M1.001 / M2 / FGSC 10212) TaxID=645133 RepID=E3Q283_COLGM|nr:uncharacterized protein GLRG_00328 [Colletotrichum graminicola M1.001]EFQ25184.1 hypothetical protein GLRG_00328 [Colletotrichum graminicola M1.001]